MCFSSIPSPKKPPEPPTKLDTRLSAFREQRDRQRTANKSGRQSTILTGGEDTATGTVKKKTLLGGA